MLSGPLSTVEEFVIGWDASLPTQQGDCIQWRGFFNHIRRVKMVQVPSPVALNVARSIQLGGQEPALDFLPALEHVKVPLTYLSPIGSKDPIKDSILDAFEPLIATRKQHMSCLRRLELDLDFQPSDSDPPSPDSTGDVIPLPKLTHLIFKGYKLYLLALVVGLVTPSLQHLDATLHDQSRDDFFHDQSSDLFHIPHLCRFRFYAGMGSKSVDDQPFKIIAHEPVSLEQVGQELSDPLSTVKELIITWNVVRWCTESYIQEDEWRGFCYHVPQVKVVRVPVEAAPNIARSFQKEAFLDLLPVLEQIEVHSTADFDELYVPICKAFEPLISARKRQGRPISLSWVYWIAE
ncbi:hypothetical protein EDB89DRAFT_2228790 [Lactarius sanguifluus]|nr:hypothetical protein EDB89DRAFT_2228790 [Lactarius sanguifluus]